MCTASSNQGTHDESQSEDSISQTLADLDALLGIEEEKKDEENEKESVEEKATVDISPAVIQAIAEAEAKRVSGSGEDGDALSKNVNDSIVRHCWGEGREVCNISSSCISRRRMKKRAKIWLSWPKGGFSSREYVV